MERISSRVISNRGSHKEDTACLLIAADPLDSISRNLVNHREIILPKITVDIHRVTARQARESTNHTLTSMADNPTSIHQEDLLDPHIRDRRCRVNTVSNSREAHRRGRGREAHRVTILPVVLKGINTQEDRSSKDHHRDKVKGSHLNNSSSSRGPHNRSHLEVIRGPTLVWTDFKIMKELLIENTILRL